MTDDARCRWGGSGQPRALVGRHGDECSDEACTGCQECTRAHCRIGCGTHSAGVCGGCLTAMRDDLADIERMYDDLPAEVTHRGINGEAMVLLGPAMNPERWGHYRGSVESGRIVPSGCDARELDDVRKWLDNEAADDHPLWTLGSWAMVYRAEFEHDEPTTLATVSSEAGYLRRNLTYIATWPHVPVEDMARDLRRCRGHLERVMHDEPFGDRANVGCFECGGDLERRLTAQGFEDVWTCRRCRRKYTPAEYNFALRAKIEEEAEAS